VFLLERIWFATHPKSHCIIKALRDDCWESATLASTFQNDHKTDDLDELVPVTGGPMHAGQARLFWPGGPHPWL
jgi:hypothetical protein